MTRDQARAVSQIVDDLEGFGALHSALVSEVLLKESRQAVVGVVHVTRGPPRTPCVSAPGP